MNFMTAVRSAWRALTANALEGDREACLAAGMSDFLAKPLKQESLVKLLQLCRPSET